MDQVRSNCSRIALELHFIASDTTNIVEVLQLPSCPSLENYNIKVNRKDLPGFNSGYMALFLYTGRKRYEWV